MCSATLRQAIHTNMWSSIVCVYETCTERICIHLFLKGCGNWWIGSVGKDQGWESRGFLIQIPRYGDLWATSIVPLSSGYSRGIVCSLKCKLDKVFDKFVMQCIIFLYFTMDLSQVSAIFNYWQEWKQSCEK